MNEKLDYKQIAEIYSNKEKYDRELNDSEMDFHRLLIETLEWKIPNLMLVTKPNFFPITVAEVGCFNGHLIGNIIINGNKNFCRFGYDVNNKAINLAKKLYSNVEFFSEDIFESNNFFDLLILSDILEHIEDDIGFLKKAAKISNYILLNLPLEKSLSNIHRKYGFDDPSGHLRSYGLKDAKKIIKLSGLSIVNFHTTCVLESRIFDKILDLKLVHEKETASSYRKKKIILSLLRSNHWLMKMYFGHNLFAFLSSPK
ncbi:methyltransferase domain-containing protein [Nodularia spumigena CS-591/04]|uniref:methyltransferase domain-containing protein n=1 Tax=Nodularia spumigena TaxID=70799 RepID=UPI00232AC077|nr:methyltransferase domain-containing protein [Nodularia spumigena]MDB9321320.1 methyltransferase domain-containing protein [Nodularia spumigena CS-591/07A]MDB9329259.1 methyltransferase domain-containing protein [Nodularia spumigena CS-591/04]